MTDGWIQTHTFRGAKMTPVVLRSPNGREEVTVNVDGIEPAQYQQLSDALGRELQRPSQTYVGVAAAMQAAVTLCPDANPADLWVHLIYNQFRTRFEKTDQSWKRVSGQAFEHLLISIYGTRLQQHGIRIRTSVPNDAVILGLVERGVGSSKTDLILETGQRGESEIFGVLHCKVSIAERLADDAPASVALMEQGYWSAVATLDAKMFPPPHGDGVVRGELGATRTGDKRRYFEVAGQFSGCFSFNLRTPPSEDETPSGSRIFALSFSEEQPDALLTSILEGLEAFRERH